jgi:hypothetical protein
MLRHGETVNRFLDFVQGENDGLMRVEEGLAII